MPKPATDPSPKFPLFPHLPPELRTQIWRATLPKAKPALYPYQRGCWQPQRLTEADEHYDPDDVDDNLYFRFHHSRLEHVQYAMPLVAVNREAHGIVMEWVRGHGSDGGGVRRQTCVRVHGQEEGEGEEEEEEEERFVFTRPYNPEQDALFVTPDTWIDFFTEPSDRQFQPDLLNVNVSIWADVTLLAVPQALLQKIDALDDLSDIFMSFDGLEKLLVIVGDLDLDLELDDGRRKERWEFESKERGGLVWNLDRRSFEYVGGEGATGGEVLSVEVANRCWGDELVRYRKREFEIWPAFAVRR